MPSHFLQPGQNWLHKPGSSRLRGRVQIVVILINTPENKLRTSSAFLTMTSVLLCLLRLECAPAGCARVDFYPAKEPVSIRSCNDSTFEDGQWSKEITWRPSGATFQIQSKAQWRARRPPGGRSSPQLPGFLRGDKDRNRIQPEDQRVEANIRVHQQ